MSTSEHMGITDYDGERINAGRERVHRAYYFLDKPASVYRRYNQ